MDKIEAIREKIGECDDIIIEQLAVRMSYIQEIISYKKATGIPILQPEQEKKQTDALKNKLGDNEFEEEILDIFKYIMKNSRRIQAKSLFDYNIFLIGFMGAGKSTIAGELKDKLEMDRVEMDQMIVEKQGMSISEIFDEYGEAYFRNLESNTLIELQKRKQTIVSCGGGVVMREETDIFTMLFPINTVLSIFGELEIIFSRITARLLPCSARDCIRILFTVVIAVSAEEKNEESAISIRIATA